MRLWRSIIKELRRLNSGRIGGKELSRLPRREKTAAVKAALAAHHDRPNRCC
ncbi:MAG TPA: hypothetical protein VMH37_20420 [Candidatus Binataceae bacterium]|nr:hypothetical protein [Candidatus Binataceae bacterium]